MRCQIPGPDTPFQPHMRDDVAKAGDRLVPSTKSLPNAAHMFIAHWGKHRTETTMTPQGMAVFKDHTQKDAFHEGMQLATFGAKPGVRAPPRRFPQDPYPSVRGDPINTLKNLWREVLEGGLFIFTTSSEQYTESLMETRLSFVEQKDKIRYICDPRLEINERADSRRHPCRQSTRFRHS